VPAPSFRDLDPSADASARAAWLYYVEDLTQAAIAQAMGITRARVIGLLAQARERGLVRVHLHGSTQAQRALEQRLVSRYGLAEAVVAPAPADARRTALMVGYAAGSHLPRWLPDGAAIGVGWGATLHASLAAVAPARVHTPVVVALLGGAHEARSGSAFEVARRLADLFGAACVPLNAPLYVTDARVREVLWSDPALNEVRERARAAGAELLAGGD
jgi:DNA-binding transcriptional regulator LsrR (DeoR family)